MRWEMAVKQLNLPVGEKNGVIKTFRQAETG